MGKQDNKGKKDNPPGKKDNPPGRQEKGGAPPGYHFNKDGVLVDNKGDNQPSGGNKPPAPSVTPPKPVQTAPLPQSTAPPSGAPGSTKLVSIQPETSTAPAPSGGAASGISSTFLQAPKVQEAIQSIQSGASSFGDYVKTPTDTKDTYTPQPTSVAPTKPASYTAPSETAVRVGGGISTTDAKTTAPPAYFDTTPASGGGGNSGGATNPLASGVSETFAGTSLEDIIQGNPKGKRLKKQRGTE